MLEAIGKKHCFIIISLYTKYHFLKLYAYIDPNEHFIVYSLEYHVQGLFINIFNRQYWPLDNICTHPRTAGKVSVKGGDFHRLLAFKYPVNPCMLQVHIKKP